MKWGLFAALSLLVSAALLTGCASLSERLRSADADTRINAQARLLASADADKREALPVLVAQLGRDDSTLRQDAYLTLTQLAFSDGGSGLDAVLANADLAQAAVADLQRYWGLYPPEIRNAIVERLAAQTQVDCESWLWERLNDPRVAIAPDSALARWLTGKTQALDVARMLTILAEAQPDPDSAAFLWKNIQRGPLGVDQRERVVAVLGHQHLDLGLREEIGRWLLDSSGWPLPDELRRTLAADRAAPPGLRARLIDELAASLENHAHRQVLQTVALDSEDEAALREKALLALVAAPEDTTADVLAQLALGSSEPPDLRHVAFERLAALSFGAAHDVALAVIVDADSPEPLRLTLLDWLDRNWRRSAETPCISLCLADFDSALCTRATEALKTHNSSRQHELEAGRHAQALRKTESLVELVTVYDDIPPELFALMPLDVRLYANAVYELAAADDLLARQSSPEALEAFAATTQQARDCLTRAMEALKADTLGDDAACRDSADRFRRDSDRLMAAIAPVRDRAVAHVQLAAALSVQIGDSALKKRFTDLFLNGNDLDAGFFIRLWFKSARQQIRQILDENPSYFKTVDKNETPPDGGDQKK